MSSIVLKPEHRRAIANHGEALYPQECRGLLLGQRNGLITRVEDVVFFDETAESESLDYRYHIPGQQLDEGEEIANSKELDIIGSFHSHVDQPARPSIHDRGYVQQAFTYVLLGVRQGRAHELAAWKLSEDGTAFFQEDIRGS
jgi:proteasome lid subunit RPN8/RPN11